MLPLITPFTDDMSAVSEVRLARLVRAMLAKGAKGFVLGADAGEFATMSISDRKQVLEIVLRETQNAIPVIVNASAVGTMSALDIAQHAQRHGARGVLVMPPHYGRFSIEEVRQHFRTIANYCAIPVVAVDLPDVYADELWDGLVEHRGIRKAVSLNTTWKSDCCCFPYATTDEFGVANMSCSPLGYFLPSALEGEPPAEEAKKWTTAFRRFGVARLVKSWMQINDVDYGPPRTPFQPIPHAEILPLKAA